MKRILIFFLCVVLSLSGCITINIENPMTQQTSNADSHVVSNDSHDSHNEQLKTEQTEHGDKVDNLEVINYTELGARYLLMGDFKHAKDSFQKALDENPNDFDALVGIAAAEFRLNETKSAIEYAKKAVKIKDDSFEAWYVLMGAYMADENWNGAWVASDMAYKYAPDDKKEEIKNIQVFILKKMG